MFMNESSFQDDSKLQDEVESLQIGKSRASNGKRGSVKGGGFFEDSVVNDPEAGEYGSAGQLPGSSINRSKILSQQRELQKKKIADRMSSSGVRSSGIRQFSSPRPTDVENQPSRFGEDDDDDPFERRPSRYSDRSNNRGDRRGSRGRGGDRGRGQIDDEYSPKSLDNPRRNDRSGSRDRERDYDRERSRDRRGERESDRGNFRKPGRNIDDDDYRDDDYNSRNYDAGSSWSRSKESKDRRSWDDDVEDEELDGRRRNSRTKVKGAKARDVDCEYDGDRGSNRGRETSVRDDKSRRKSRERSVSSDLSSDEEMLEERKDFPPYDSSGDKFEKKVKLDLTDMKSFLSKAVPKGAGVVQCYIERNKTGSNKLFPEYCLYMKDGDRFLLTAKKRPHNKTSNYLVSMQRGDLSRTSNNYMGKLRANFIGTEFVVYDNGLNPKECDIKSTPEANIRQELAIAVYASNVLGSRGPRKMKVCVPRVREDGTRVSWRPLCKEDEMLVKCKEQDHTNLTYLINKPPRWNEQVGAYVLNFNGRVTMASVKNFQLVTPEDQETVVLQFGRVGKDLFTMDFRYPLCPFQAFATTLSSFDSKLACE